MSCAYGAWTHADCWWWCTGIELNGLNMIQSSVLAHPDALSIYSSSQILLTLLILFAFSQFSSVAIHDPSRMNAIMWPVWVHKTKTNKRNSKRATILLLLWLRSSMRVLFASAAVWIVSILCPLHACTAFGAPNRTVWEHKRRCPVHRANSTQSMCRRFAIGLANAPHMQSLH